MSQQNYGRLCTEFFSRSKPAADEESLAFYMDYATGAGGPVLLPMCGTGHYLLPLLQAGVDAEGFDRSPAMVERCRENLQAAGLEDRVVCEDLLTRAPGRPCRLALIPSGSIGLLTEDEHLRAAFAGLASNLVPGGRLVFDFDNRSTPVAAVCAAGPIVTELPGEGPLDPLRLTVTHSLNKAGDVLTACYTYEKTRPDGAVEEEREDIPVRLHDAGHLTGLLEEAGFRSSQVWSSFAREDHDSMFSIIEAIRA